MRRNVVISLTLIASLLCALLAVSVEAQRGRRQGRRARRATTQQAAPNSAAIAQSLGELRWGMEPRRVHEFFANKIRERFREPLSKAPGTIEEDRLRDEMDSEIRRLRES